MEKKILIVEDDIAFGKMIANFLKRYHFEVEITTNGEEAKVEIKSQTYDLLITDLQLPDGSGLELLDFSRKNAPQTQTILMTGYAEVSTAVEAIKKGALDYISKPFRPEELVMIVEQAFESQDKNDSVPISSEIKTIPKEKKRTEVVTSGFVAGNSEISKKFNDYLKLVGPTQMNVLLQGESGTGKEVAANAIHNYSDRNDKNFVAVDCGAIPKEIAASEFFGHIKGSFTGAITDKKGHFEAAHLGTLFLDEVGNLSYENQIQLLRALQERKIKPVGSSKEIEVDVRIVTATNEDLVKAVSEGTFREDLYHRLNEFSVQIPSLRERTEDLFLFTHYFLEQANASLGKNVIGLSKQVEEAFKRYAWPGNLRELKNVIKRSVLLTTSHLIPLDVIPREVIDASEKKAAPKDFSKNSNEKQLILNALKEADYNKSRAAKLLNITRKTLYNKIEQYQIEL